MSNREQPTLLVILLLMLQDQTREWTVRTAGQPEPGPAVGNHEGGGWHEGALIVFGGWLIDDVATRPLGPPTSASGRINE